MYLDIQNIRERVKENIKKKESNVNTYYFDLARSAENIQEPEISRDQKMLDSLITISYLQCTSNGQRSLLRDYLAEKVMQATGRDLM